MSDNEKTDLEQLLKSPGWLRFEHTITEYWQKQLGPFLEGAADEREDAMAMQRLRQVVAANKAVRMALAWPSQRLAQLTRATETTHTTFTRGGYDVTTAR